VGREVEGWRGEGKGKGGEGPTSKEGEGRAGEGREERGEEGRGSGGKGRVGEALGPAPPTHNFWLRHCARPLMRDAVERQLCITRRGPTH